MADALGEEGDREVRASTEVGRLQELQGLLQQFDDDDDDDEEEEAARSSPSRLREDLNHEQTSSRPEPDSMADLHSSSEDNHETHRVGAEFQLVQMEKALQLASSLALPDLKVQGHTSRSQLDLKLGCG